MNQNNNSQTKNEQYSMLQEKQTDLTLNQKLYSEMESTLSNEAETPQQIEEKTAQPQEPQQPTALQEDKVEEKKQEPEPIEITAELVDSLDIDEDVKGYVKDYLNGYVNSVTTLAYKALKDYVQNELRNGTADSTDADTAQLGSTTDDGSLPSMGNNRGENRRVGREQGKGDVSQQRPGREDSQGGLFSVPGEESNSDVESDTSNDAADSGTNRRTGSSRSGGKRSNVRKSAGPTSGSSVSTDAGQGENTSKSQVDEKLEDLDKELEDLLSQARRLLNYSANTVGAFGNTKMFELVSWVGKIGYIYTKKGLNTFKKW